MPVSPTASPISRQRTLDCLGASTSIRARNTDVHHTTVMRTLRTRSGPIHRKRSGSDLEAVVCVSPSLCNQVNSDVIRFSSAPRSVPRSPRLEAVTPFMQTAMERCPLATSLARPLLQHRTVGNGGARQLARFKDDQDNVTRNMVLLNTVAGVEPDLRTLVLPGDVLFVQGVGSWLLGVGTAGGPFGHVMLVIARPECIQRCSEKGRFLSPIWPPEADQIWLLRVLECTRSRANLHVAELLLHADVDTGSLVLLGELSDSECHVDTTEQQVELWHSPDPLRKTFSEALFTDALRETLADDSKGWSWTTAARCLLRPARSLGTEEDTNRVVQEVRAGWAAEPICTSVVIALWQRYLFKLAESHGPAEIRSAKAAELVMQWMPLRADSCLPGDVMKVMQQCGWTARMRFSQRGLDQLFGDCCCQWR